MFSLCSSERHAIRRTSYRKFFLDYAAARRQPVTTMSLLKILYFAHAWHLAKTNKPLVGQPFEAWQYGPVSRVVYDQFRRLGGKPIQSRAEVLNAMTARFEAASYDNVDEGTVTFLRNVFGGSLADDR